MDLQEVIDTLTDFAKDHNIYIYNLEYRNYHSIRFERPDGKITHHYARIQLYKHCRFDHVLVSDIIEYLANELAIDLKTGKNISTRPSKDEYYLGIAQAVAKRSTCIRRQYGAVIVKDDRIISTGYNGSARGCDNCCDKGVCWREENHIPHGEQYEKCQAVHAEANAIINGNPSDMIGATLYLAGFEDGKLIEEPKPCMMCERLITNARIEKVINKF